ncbi:sodium/glutamate symporter [Pedosphaera parvula]|uniref:Sodium/glutamate symporter n=1 Tax=Pedosphaera parvula (strain Ellin514) TaxID=320771 RepID=B9XDY0_PEDPL|nr:sodium/glutamate symporter [Pedosphaera parvula]EEF61871.1 sodium/glutamate symporter [Pedosphaera parvula Ellin514]
MNSISAWVLLLFAVPVILVGEFLFRRVKFLSHFNIPIPVVGGMLIALMVLGLNVSANASGHGKIQFATKVDARWWTWLVTPETEWRKAPMIDVQLPFLVGFFTCIGLNASWQLVRRGGVQVIVLLVLATVLAILQNILGITLAYGLHVPPLMGVICGSLTLTGGPGTALGFAPTLAEAGVADAAVIAIVAATFGIFVSSLIGGPVGSRLIRSKNLQVRASGGELTMTTPPVPSSFIGDLRTLAGLGWMFFVHLLLLFLAIKTGAWLSYFMRQAHLTFPVYMGAMIVGMVLRNVIDFSGWRIIDPRVISRMDSVLLALFIAMAMMSLNLAKLAGTALPMTVILLAQIVLMIVFARYVTFPIMGRDYDAAIMTAGHIGFGLGITPNAVANMKSLVESFGPSPQAFLVVPIVGAFLIDFTNALTINGFINLFK